jgi:hypothetical protein
MFIQFLHSEKEHIPNALNHKDWNYGDHYRKFMKAYGVFVKDYKLHSKQLNSELMLWGEWEPQSNSRILTQPTRDFPKYLYEPYFDLSAPLTQKIENTIISRQNTDPFIFGDNFHYFLCRQSTIKGYTKLTNLQPGDVILFGSHRREWINKAKKQKKMWFVLDTVFVVSDNPAPIIYAPNNFVNRIRPNISVAYYNISFVSEYSSNLHTQVAVPLQNGLKLYFGATFSNPINNMFSFVPSLPFQSNIIKGFKRPTIKIPNVISDGLNTNFKPSAKNNPDLTKYYWEETVKQVLKQELFLGIKFRIPINNTPNNCTLVF